MSPPQPKLEFAEYFAGIGLVRYALERHGWRAVFANDNDESKRTMYQGHFGDRCHTLMPDDVHELSADDVPDSLLATASFPCNDLSLAGAMLGLAGKQSGAFWGFHRILKDMGKRRPPLVLLENVMGFLYTKQGAEFETVISALADLDYTCDAFAINASHFVPQSRPRLFVVALQRYSDIPLRKLQTFLHASELRPQKLVDFVNAHPDLPWNIRDLPPLPMRTITLKDIIEKLPDDAPEWWSSERVDYLRNQMSEAHGKTADEMRRSKQWQYGAVFRRMRNGKSMAELRVDGLAGALRTPRGGSGRQILYVAGRGHHKARLMTPVECARLMGANDYKIVVPANQAFFGFGDAVCVPVIEWIAENYLNQLARQLERAFVEAPAK